MEKTYNIIKEKLPNVNIDFTQSNLMSLDDKKIGRQDYDFIYLSNILYYLNLNPMDCSKFLKQKISPLLKENGRSVIHYIYKQAGNRSFSCDNIISNIDKRDLKTIETFKNTLNVEEIQVNKSGSGSKDVALVLRKVA